MKIIFLPVITCLFVLLSAPFAEAADKGFALHQLGSLSLKSETGLAMPVSNPQSELFSLGGSQTLKIFYELNRYLDVGPSATFLGLSGDGFGTAWAIGGSLQLKRPHDTPTINRSYTPWVDVDSLYVRTGVLNRFGFAFGTGLLVPVNSDRTLSVGPFVRYFHIVQYPDRKGYDNRDAQIIILGVTVEVSSGIMPPMVEQPPVVIPPPVVEESAAEPPVVEQPPVVEEPVVVSADLELNQRVQFEKNSAELRDTESSVLDEIVQLLKDRPEFSVTVVGYTSSEGNEAHNLKLSLWRANAVVSYLVARGIAKERLGSVGYDSLTPVDTNDTEAGRVNNRRVEFIVYQAADKKGE